MTDGPGAYLVIDVGTGNLRVVVVSAGGEPVAVAHELLGYDEGEVFTRTFDPARVRDRVWHTVRRLTGEDGPAGRLRVDGIACVSQRHAFVLIDRDGVAYCGVPNVARPGDDVAPCRTPDARRACEVGGSWPSELFPAVKLAGLPAGLAARTAAVTSISEWLAYELTGTLAFESSQAGDTLLFDIRRRAWDADLAAAAGVPARWLPDPVDAGTHLGGLAPAAAAGLALPAGTPVYAAGSDTQLAVHAVPAGPGDIVVVSGSTTPVTALLDSPRLDPRTWTGCHATPGRWLLESNCGVTGLGYQWVRDVFCGGRPYGELEEAFDAARPPRCVTVLGPRRMDARVPVAETGGVMFAVPPGDGFGVSDVAEGALWDIACAVRANAEQIAEITGHMRYRVWAVGGGFRSTALREMTAHLLGRPVRVPSWHTQASAVGAYAVITGRRPDDGGRVVDGRPGGDAAAEHAYASWRRARDALVAGQGTPDRLRTS